MALILAMPLMNQLQPKWEALATLYSVREKPSQVYHWSTFVLSNILAEFPYNIGAGTLFFVAWYFPVGFWRPFSGAEMNSRGIYQWLMIMAFELWWSTFGQAIAALTPNSQTAAILTTLFASFVLSFNGVLQPLRSLTEFWHWMYHVSPYTYLIGGLVSNVISGTTVTCAPTELNIVTPPSGQTCQQFIGAFVAQNAGQILNPNATSACEYCKYATGDEYLTTVSMQYGDRWRNFGFMFAYIIFNIFAAFLFFYMTKVARFSLKQLALTLKKKNRATEG
jgi:ABC-type multidrug transport system permease subunit